MQTVKNSYQNSIEIKKSIFHAFLTPIENFKELQEELRKTHPKARHIVWAKREEKGGQILEYSSDDGEPKGTSGPPALQALRGANLVNIAVLIVRYFGGIKLGTGGLVRAYSAATNGVINEAELVPFVVKERFLFFSSYPILQRVEYLLNGKEIEILNKSFDEGGARWEILISNEDKTSFLDEIGEFEGFSYKNLSTTP
ncbi:MAG: YigZ family protein [Campylobacteraceae bacterium]|nr:YigZ family protein [Campylobacteraceae bacterium]